MSKTKLSVTIDKELKNEAKKILDDIGLDYSTAISIYFTQIVKKKKIPFEHKKEQNILVILHANHHHCYE